MGESERYHRESYKQKNRSRFSLGADGNALMNLFAINVVFFLILMVIQVGVLAGQHTPEYFYQNVVQWLEMPADLTKLSERPWTFLSYMFTDTGGNIIRAISNMIWLWGFGYILQQMAGNDKIIPIYIYGGLAGGVFFILAKYFIAPLAPYRETAAMLGANASVMAVAMATTSLEPNYRFFTQIRGGIPIWVLMTIYILIDFAGVAGYGAAQSLAHLGGALAGFLFVVFLRRGKDGSIWMNSFYRWVINLFEPKKTLRNPAKDKIFYRTGDRKPFTITTDVTQQKVDELLDKISQKGFHFLTDEEKAFLKKASENEDL
ncbi:MAG: rhomboid family intramembrane serine protease [Ferruginibacter sp.]